MATKTRPLADPERAAIRAIIAQGGTVCVFGTGGQRLLKVRGTPRLVVAVALALVLSLELGNRLPYSCKGLCRRFGFSYGSALKAWHWLEEAEWLRAVLNDHGQVRYWTLSPYLAWKGRPDKARIAQRIWDAEGQLTRLAAQWQE